MPIIEYVSHVEILNKVISVIILEDDLEKFKALILPPEYICFFCLLSDKTKAIGRYIRRLILDRAEFNKQDRDWLENLDEAYAVLDSDWSQLPVADLAKLGGALKTILVARNDTKKLARLYALNINYTCPFNQKNNLFQQTTAIAAILGNVECLKLLKEFEPSAFEQVYREYEVNCLYFAAEHGRIKAVDWLLESGINNVKKPSKIGMTAVHIAAEHHQLDIVALLLRKGGDEMKKPQVDGATALMCACGAGDEEIVKLLLKEGGDEMKKPDENGHTALSAAVQFQHIPIARLLLSQSSDVFKKARKDGVTALHTAADLGPAEMVELLLDLGGDEMKMPDKNGATALHNAAARGNVRSVALLLEKGGEVMRKPNKRGESALNVAVVEGHKEVVKLLLANSNDAMKMPDETGCTALHQAAASGNREIAELLLTHCADMLLKKMNDGKTPLDVAREMKHKELVDLFTRALDNLNKSDAEDPSVKVYLAAKQGKLETTAQDRELFSDASGFNALHVAITKGDAKTAATLLELGYSPDTLTRDEHELTPLMLAIKYNNPIAEVLMEKCSNINVCSANGLTALGIAAQGITTKSKAFHMKIIGLLLGKSCDLTPALGIDKESTLFILNKVHEYFDWKSSRVSDDKQKWLKELFQLIHFDKHKWFVTNKLTHYSPLKLGLPPKQFLQIYFEILFEKLRVNLTWRCIDEYHFEIRGKQALDESLDAFRELFQKTVKPELAKQVSKPKFNLKLTKAEDETLLLEFDSRTLNCFINYLAQNDCLPLFQQKIKSPMQESKGGATYASQSLLSGTSSRKLIQQEILTIINYMKRLSAGCKINFSPDPEKTNGELNCNVFYVSINFAPSFNKSKRCYEFKKGKFVGAFTEADLASVISRLQGLAIDVCFYQDSHSLTATFNCDSNLDSSAWNKTVFDYFNKHFSKKDADTQKTSTANFPMWSSSSSSSTEDPIENGADCVYHG